MKKVILILIFFSALQTSFAQRDFSFFRQQINEAEYIFEAKSLGFTCYWTTDSQIYTSTILDITKIFKGDLKLGTVEIIGVGGNLDGNLQDNECTVKFPKDDWVICFAKKTKREVYNINKLENDIAIEIIKECEEGIIYIGNLISIDTKFGFIEPYAYGCKTHFLTERELYDALPKRIDKNSMINETEINTYTITPEGRDKFLRELHRSQGATESEIDTLLKNPLMEKQIYENIKQRNKKNKNKDGSSNKSSGAHQITYSFRNPKHSGTSDFEFDIYVQGNNDSTYVTINIIYLNYDSEVFGNDAHIRTIVTQGDLMLQGRYYNPFINPYSDSILSINCALYDPLPHQRYHLTTTPKQLCHVKMTAQNCSKDVEFKYVREPMLTKSTYLYIPNSPEQGGIPYYVKTYDSKFVMASCTPPTINRVTASLKGKSISLDSLIAGVGIIIRVTGTNFGNNRGVIRVRNVKMPENNFDDYGPIDSIDIRFWSDTLILFQLASLNGTSPNSFTVGSGKIRILNKTNNQFTTSILRLNIISTIANIWSSNYKKKMRTFLGSNYPNGGILFLLHDSIKQNKDQRIEACINAALAQWRCSFGSNFSISNDTTTKSLSAQDGKSIIYFKNIVGKTMAETRPWGYEYKLCNDTFALINEIDLAINSNTDWFYDETCSKPITLMTFDFYTACLHEFGHAHQINHIADNTKLMYPEMQFNKRFNVISLNEKSAVDTILNLGKKINTFCKPIKYNAMQNGALCPPVLTNFKINNGQDSTNTSKISLYNTAINNPISYAVNETGNFTNTVWYAYSTKPTYTLVGLGKHKLYIKVIAANKEESNILTDSIVLTAKESKTTDNQDNTLLGQNSISIYPNPTSNIINIVNSNQEETCICEIFNTLGTKVIAIVLNSNENQIDLSYLPSGIYIVKTKSKKQIFYTKILKKDN